MLSLDSGTGIVPDAIATEECACTQKAVVSDRRPTLGFGHMPKIRELGPKMLRCQRLFLKLVTSSWRRQMSGTLPIHLINDLLPVLD
jgi:hypothetical protein